MACSLTFAFMDPTRLAVRLGTAMRRLELLQDIQQISAIVMALMVQADADYQAIVKLMNGR